AVLFLLLAAGPAFAADQPGLAGVVRSAQSGPWSAAATWEGGKVPTAGRRGDGRTGDALGFDIRADPGIRSIHVAGVLTFAPDRDTRLEVGLIKIQPGDAYSEDGFDCEAHLPAAEPGKPRPALEVGTPDRPIAAGRTALIRLQPVEGLDKESCPAIVCCGGRVDLHRAPPSPTWVKLRDTAKKEDRTSTPP